ncbi:hypothetical protein QYB59_002100 [Clostridium perfringens]|nr:hypothetical protein [Clostridium perfringens]
MDYKFYRIYGLNVRSQIEFPELLSVSKVEENEIDVEISIGQVDEEIKNTIPKYSWFKYEKDRMVFKVENVGCFYIHSGKSIIVEPYEGIENQLIKTYTLGTSFGMILNQRNIIAIHGGTILIDDDAIILTGQSGAGKSTLTNAFRHYGYKFMADDVSATSVSEEACLVEPAYPQQKICRDAMEKMGYNIKDFKLIDEGREKYVIPTHKTFVKENKNLKAIFEIEPYEGESVEIHEVFGQDKMKTILRNIYRIEIIAPHGMAPQYFKKAVNLAKKIRIFKIRRPRNTFSVDMQIDFINKVMC